MKKEVLFMGDQNSGLFEEGSLLQRVMNLPVQSGFSRNNKGVIISLVVPGTETKISSGRCSTDEEAAERILAVYEALDQESKNTA